MLNWSHQWDGEDGWESGVELARLVRHLASAKMARLVKCWFINVWTARQLLREKLLDMLELKKVQEEYKWTSKK